MTDGGAASGQPDRRPTRALAARLGLLVAALLGAWEGTWRLGTASSINDEVAYRTAVTALLRGDWTLNNQHPPLAKELIAVFRVAGTHAGLSQVVADRSLGVCCFLLTGFVLAALARPLAGPWAGVAAAALWWALPVAPGVLVAHVDRYALLEAPLVLFLALAALAAQRVAVPGRDAGRWWVWWLVLGLSVGAATASKLFGVLAAPLPLAPIAVSTVMAAPGRRLGTALRSAAAAAAAAVVALALFLATYAPMGHHAAAALRTAVAYQLHHADGGHIQTVAGHNHLFPPWWSPWWFEQQYLGTVVFAALWVAAGLGLVVAAQRRSGAVPALWLVSTSAAVALMPIKLPQYQDVLVPALDVLAGTSLVTLAGAGLRRARRAREAGRSRTAPALPAALLAVLLLAGLASGAVRQAGHLATLRPGDYRVAARVLREHGVTGPVTVWGDATGLAFTDPHLLVTTVMPADCHPVALVTDTASTHRLPGVDVAAWRRHCGRGYQRVGIDRVTVYLRR